MADNGNVENQTTSDGHTVQAVTQGTGNGTVVTVLHGTNNAGDEYYWLDVLTPSGGHYQKEISTRDRAAWNAATAAGQLPAAFARTPGTWGFLTDWGKELTPDEANTLAQYAIRTGTNVSENSVAQPSEVLGDPNAPLHAGPLGGQARPRGNDSTPGHH